MKIYRLKKDIIGARKWMEFEFYNKERLCCNLYKWESLGQVLDLVKAVWVDNLEYFEEAKPPIEFKVGDYVVYEWRVSKKYIKIIEIYVNENWDIDYNDIKGEDLRKPTEEELNLYFR